MKDVLIFYYFGIRSAMKVFVLIFMLTFMLGMIILCFPFLCISFVRKYLDKLGAVIQDVFEEW